MIRKVGLIFATLVCGCVAVAACSSSSTPVSTGSGDSGGGGGGDTGGGGGGDTGGGMSTTLVGSYDNCTLTPNVTITVPTMLMYTTPITGGTATITGSGSSLTAVLAGTGAMAFDCTLMITATGDSATVPMQSCDTTIAGFPVVITFTSGTVTEGAGDGGELLNAMASVTITGTDGGTAIMGSGTLDAACTKM